MEIIITQKDVLNNDYTDIYNCPLAKAMQQALNDKNIYVAVRSINTENKMIGVIDPPFTKNDFINLETGVITEFKTTYTAY